MKHKPFVVYSALIALGILVIWGGGFLIRAVSPPVLSPQDHRTEVRRQRAAERAQQRSLAESIDINLSGWTVIWDDDPEKPICKDPHLDGGNQRIICHKE
jgi:hypothetical protein